MRVRYLQDLTLTSPTPRPVLSESGFSRYDNTHKIRRASPGANQNRPPTHTDRATHGRPQESARKSGAMGSAGRAGTVRDPVAMSGGNVKMWREIGTIKKAGSRNVDVQITRYSGGPNGPCVQLRAEMEEGGDGYVQLTIAVLEQALLIARSEPDRKSIYPWRACKSSCTVCGKEMLFRPVESGGVQVVGGEPMEYMHSETGTRECVTFDTARPYSHWGKRRWTQR